MKDYLVRPGKNARLDARATGHEWDEEKKEKESAKRKIARNIEAIKELQQKLYAEGARSLLIVLQAMDAGGKDGAIRKVFGPVNPQGCRVVSFKAPTTLEKSYDFLWRVHAVVPPKGILTVFNRSHYEEVLIVRVHDWITKDECKERYRTINEFERMLHNAGTRIIKFFLYISRDEQRRRFKERIETPEKQWKFNADDLKESKLWDRYMEQFEEVLTHTSTKRAPWYVVPADNKTYRNLVISTVVRRTMQRMDPQFPPPDPALEGLKIDQEPVGLDRG